MESNTKDWIQYGSAIAMLTSGVILVFLSFFLLNFIANSILMYVAQTLTFAGAIFGLNLVYKTKLGIIENNAKESAQKYVKEYVDKVFKINEDRKD